ncbi:MAG: carbohydrate ABC transporter permease [Sedimentisphaerales bacterium]|nr:carbohydrate ABC transporter permease [Sedimentisphaerales bacterium]
MIFFRVKKRRYTLGSILLYALTLLMVLWAITPFFWSLSSSVKSLAEVYRVPPTIIPVEPTMENYLQIFEKLPFIRFFINSVFISAVTIVSTVVLSVLAAYAFSRFRFPFRSVLLIAILVPRIIPSITRVIPLYQIFQHINLLDNYMSIIGPYVADALPIAVWILIGFFDGIPKELEESARIDGCSRLMALWKVIIPLTTPGIVTAALFTFLRAWNEFVLAFTFVGRGLMLTLPVAHYRVFEFFGVRNWGAINAFTILAVVPIITFFLILERHLIKSLVAGAVKG